MPNTVSVRYGSTGAHKVLTEADQLKAKFTSLQKTTAKGFITGVGAAAGLKAFSLAGDAIGSVTDIVKEATQAFLADEESQNRMRASLKANVDGWNGNTDAIEQFITAQQKLGFDDETLRDSLTVLVGATHDVAKAQTIAATAMDLARFKGIDLRTASEALIKVEGGHYRALAQLGIKLKDGATSEEALAAVQKIAAGQAEAYANTLSGKLAAAAVKSKEALENLGQATAEFSADFETAKAGAIENFVTGLDFLVDGLHASEQPFERQIELARVVIGLNPLLSQSQKDAANATLDNAAAQHKLAVAMSDLSNFPGKLADDMGTYSTKAAKASGATGDLTDTTDGLTDAEKKNIAETNRVAGVLDYLAGVAGKADQALSALEDTLFGPTERAGDLAQAQKDLAQLLTDGPEKGAKNLRIWQGEVAAAKQRIFDLQYQMKQQEGPAALDKWLRNQRDHLSAADKKGRDYYNTLIAINSLKLGPAARAALGAIGGTGRYSGKIVPYASGGHYSAGVPRMVGENGPEIDVPDHGGTIIPNGSEGSGSSGSGWSGGTVINVYGVSVLTPGSAETLARQLEPVITRAQQKRGMFAGAR